MSDPRSEDVRELTEEELAAIEEKYDEGAATRSVTPAFGKFLRYIALTFAIYHYLTAGFALPPDYWHMGWHLSGLFILTYSFYPLVKTKTSFDLNTGALRLGGVPYLDVILMILGVMSALYLGFAWRGIEWLGVEEMTFRMGNPNGWDMLFGCILIVLVLDIARRTLGWILPLIISIFISYALFGP
ncbi:MAG: TRAP transporter permease, partial [Pseudomonadota bacterium]